MFSASVLTALSYICGIFSHTLNEGFIMIFFISFLFVFLFNSFLSRRFNLKLLICIILFCTGNFRYNSFINKDNILDDFSNEYVYITGTVADIPKLKNERYSYTVRTDSFKFETVTLNHKSTVYISSETGYSFGDTVKFYGVLKPYSENINSAAFNPEKYYNTQSIFYRMYSEYSEYADVKIKKNFSYFLSEQKNKLYKLISAKEQDKIHHDMSSRIFLNFAPDFNEDLKSDFLKSATWTYLYSPRIHFLMIMAFFALLTRLVNKKIRDFVLLLILIAYAAINSVSGSALRITIFTVITVFYVYKNGFHNFTDTISSTVLITGLINPMVLYNSGFIISVLSCIAVKIFYKPINNKIIKLLKFRRLSSFISIYIIFVIIMAPVSLVLKFDLSLYSMLLMPVFFILISICCITAPFYFIFNIEPAGNLLHFIYDLMIYISGFVKKLPYASFYFTCPSLLFMLAWFSGILALRYKLARKQLFTAFAIFSCILAATEYTRLDDIEVHFVSVGQGDGAVISLPYKSNIIIDAGGTDAYSDYNHGEAEFVPYLKYNGLSEIDAALVSHYHSDHAEGVISVLNNFRVKKLFLPYYMPSDEIFCKLEQAANDSGTHIIYIRNNEIISFGHDLTAKVIFKDNKDNLNDSSAVYKFEYGDFSALFTGDIGEEAEKDIIKSGYTLNADILKVPHHGSKYSSCDEFISAVSPKYAFAGIGLNNVYGFPRPETLQRYKNHKIPFFSTASSGNMVVKSDKKENIKIYRN